MQAYLTTIDNSGNSAITANTRCKRIRLTPDGLGNAGDYQIQAPNQSFSAVTKAMGATTEFWPKPGKDMIEAGEIVGYGKALAPAASISFMQEEFSQA